MNSGWLIKKFSADVGDSFNCDFNEVKTDGKIELASQPFFCFCINTNTFFLILVM